MDVSDIHYIQTSDTLFLVPNESFSFYDRHDTRSLYLIHCSEYPQPNIVFDITNIPFLDSMAFGRCIELANDCHKHDRCLVITGANHSVLKIVDTGQMRDYLHIEEDRTGIYKKAGVKL